MNVPDSRKDPVGPPAILIVDDDFDGANGTGSILTEGGYEVASEARGDIVLQLVRAPSCVSSSPRSTSRALRGAAS
jgi:hypothetical protein